MKYLNPILGKVPVHPLVFVPDLDTRHMREKFDTLREHGFEGYLIQGWDRDLSTESLKESTGIF